MRSTKQSFVHSKTCLHLAAFSARNTWSLPFLGTVTVTAWLDVSLNQHVNGCKSPRHMRNDWHLWFCTFRQPWFWWWILSQHPELGPCWDTIGGLAHRNQTSTWGLASLVIEYGGLPGFHDPRWGFLLIWDEIFTHAVPPSPNLPVGRRQQQKIQSKGPSRADMLQDAACCGTSSAGQRGSSSTGPVV
jgi:hypothetical protein